MSLTIPEIKVTGWTTPITNAYGFILQVNIGTWTAGQTRIDIGVFANADSAGAGEPPLKIVSLVPGQVLAPASVTPEVTDTSGNIITPAVDTPAVTMPTLTEFMTNPDFATAFGTIRAILYDYAKQYAEFVGSTDVD